MLDRLLALETSGIKLGLENITRLCAALGDPQRHFISLHVAGTNGKGSVAAMVHAALTAAGCRAARYTSPHLVDLAERFVIRNASVDNQELARAANDVLDCAEALRSAGTLSVYPTFFEATTATAFELFRRAGVEVAVIEVGLGGRFDSTNILSSPVAAITSIGLDHQELLGDSLKAIAFEKAGIIKPGMTVVTGVMPAEARQVISSVAAEQDARIVHAATGVEVDAHFEHGRATLVIETPEDRYGPVPLALRGEHQVDNALVAIRLLEVARGAGIRIPSVAIEYGLSGVEWPARLELIVMPGGQRLLLDAAHNVDGAHALAAYLARWHPERPALVIGVMRDKDVEGMIGRLRPVISSVIATAASTPRAMPAEELGRRARSQCSADSAATDVSIEADPLLAVARALTRSSTVCVAGSMFLAGEMHGALKRRAILR